MSKIVIRAAEENDREDILGMLQRLQNYEHALHAGRRPGNEVDEYPVSYTHLRAHETDS